MNDDEKVPYRGHWPLPKRRIESMPPASLSDWMQRLGFNKVRAADALGISRNTLDGYLSGKHDIPKTVALACAAIAYGLPEP